MIKKITCILLLTVSFVWSQAPTVGLLFLHNNVSEGYTLFTPEVNNSVYLINNCGEKVNEWTFTELPGATCYLLENGTLLRAGKDKLEIRDWDNTVLWNYEMNTNGLNQHHDIEPLPNGNILCIITDSYSNTEIIANGKDPLKVDQVIGLDKIVELKPIGTDNAEIVWEWKFIDHLIQDYDNTKANFGIIGNHPELIDINYVDSNVENLERGYTHVNGIDYNANLDQIIISARNLNEIYIIDHSTTTTEASGHTGGNSNLGGDILWRWGNPRVYKQGGVEDQKLFSQHDVKWVEPGYLDEGKISVFNNGEYETRAYSTVHLLDPEISGNTYTKENNTFKPLNFNWSWGGSILERTMYEEIKSGTHSLPNGNFIICESSLGQVSEITKAGEHVWTYKNPSGNSIFNQFENVSPNFNSIFRAEKYPSNYIGFSGKDLTPKGIIENENSVSNACLTLSIVQYEINNIRVINPVSGNVLKFNQNIKLDAIRIIDMNGRIIFTSKNFFDDHVPINVKSGFYIIEFEKEEIIRRIKIIVN
ncbi:aryl-sulfate sulfotransferase [Mariniflexile litorale]|uniref:Aryl-sulfate sulfotransferase n=1 Tax=Mariniflexile litorale TaxID=3045158 RepID=A0AAU7EJA6_9FLAO|nr:aryl-sulfate sulfotransferase [Mariniflexile sp. KMM 9835]MDQ8209956.1 aryl-sulfate sulfotransferase [Mariniflexile sp. KMM 9835]